MGKFLVVYHGSISATEQMKDATPEDMKKGMEAWMAWAGRCGEGLVDIGSPLGSGLRVTDSGSSPSETSVVGCSILQADDGRSVGPATRSSPPGLGGGLRD